MLFSKPPSFFYRVAQNLIERRGWAGGETARRRSRRRRRRGAEHAAEGGNAGHSCFIHAANIKSMSLYIIHGSFLNISLSTSQLTILGESSVCVSSALCELVCVYFDVWAYISPLISDLRVFFQKATLPNTLLGLGKGECALRKSRRGRRSGGDKGGGGERKRGRVCQGFTEEGGKSEEPRFKFDLFVPPPCPTCMSPRSPE